MLELNAKTTALVVIDLQEAPAVSPCVWCALAGLPITPKH